MREKFGELFEYTHHFNHKVIEMMKTHKEILPERCFFLLNHTLNAHQIWLSRILNEKPFGVWEIHLFEDLEEINNSNFQKSLSVLNNSDLNKTISYWNSKGDLFENKTEDILFHIINHTTYHRGQMMILFRESGLEPIVSDYIFYKR